MFSSCLHGPNCNVCYAPNPYTDSPLAPAAPQDEATFSATALCPVCGAGLCYRKGEKAWTCSATPAHASYPFNAYEIKSENQPSANGRTTRPAPQDEAQALARAVFMLPHTEKLSAIRAALVAARREGCKEGFEAGWRSHTRGEEYFAAKSRALDLAGPQEK